MCARVQILTSNTVLMETARNSTKSTINHYPAEYKSAHRCSRWAMVCVIMFSTKTQVMSAKKIMLHSPKRAK